jgi:hypothetical protein
MKVHLKFGAALILLATSPAWAVEGTIQSLRDKCRTAESLSIRDEPLDTLVDAPDAYYCLGFMSGMGFALQLNCADKNYKGPLAIMKGTTGQRVRAFLNWADAHPETWGRSEAYAVRALAETLPCDQEK